MASFRRAQSPAYHNRSYQNGFNDPFSSSSYKYGSSSSSSSSSSPSLSTSLLISFKRLLTWIFIQRFPTKKGSTHQSSSWKWLLYRFLLFFILGFFLGLMPFGYRLDDLKPQDLVLDIKPPQVHAQHDLTNSISKNSIVFGIHSVSLRKRDDFKQLIIVTPTYNRALQAYFLHRLSQTLRLVPPPLLWIVVEMNLASVETSEILRRSGVMYRHLVCMKNSTNLKDRGVYQRNTALEHIERHQLDGIVYFADDDNVYSLELFESLRDISRFGTWPVAMLASSKNKAILEGPVCNGSQVIGWHTNEKSKRLRRFHVDMSGFAFNSTILWDPKRWHRLTKEPIRQRDTVKEGFQETTFIEQLVEDEGQMEATPYDCLRVMNWHLHLEARNFDYPRGWKLHKNLDVIVPLS